MEFLGHKINASGVHTQKRLVGAVIEWPIPKSINDVQSFLGLTNYYRKFVLNYAKIAQPISDLVRGKTYKWSSTHQQAFENLKQALVTAPVLAHPSSEKTFTVSTDASKYAVGATLEQYGHPIAYLSHCLSNTEMNWDTGDQKLLAFIIALKEWSVYLRGRSFIFRTDHEPIRNLQSKARLTGRQYRWLDIFQEHSFDVEHIPGIQHVAPDALSRRPDHMSTLALKSIPLLSPDFSSQIRNSYEQDSWATEFKPYQTVAHVATLRL